MAGTLSSEWQIAMLAKLFYRKKKKSPEVLKLHLYTPLTHWHFQDCLGFNLHTKQRLSWPPGRLEGSQSPWLEAEAGQQSRIRVCSCKRGTCEHPCCMAMRFAFEEHSKKKKNKNQINPGLNHRLFKTLPVASQTALVDPMPYHLF